jgi:hypothetical protein
MTPKTVDACVAVIEDLIEIAVSIADCSCPRWRASESEAHYSDCPVRLLERQLRKSVKIKTLRKYRDDRTRCAGTGELPLAGLGPNPTLECYKESGHSGDHFDRNWQLSWSVGVLPYAMPGGIGEINYHKDD